MGEIKSTQLVLPILAAFSRHAQALDWTHRQTTEHWGAVALASETFAFTETSYYATEMGDDLKKRLFAFERLIDPADLPARKHHSNQWEVDYRRAHDHPENRPLNLDPGYLTEAKLVLATTKDRDHRLYLSQGIFAEVTLSFVGGSWRKHPWTYRDYQRPEYHEFFDRCREYYRHRLGKA